MSNDENKNIYSDKDLISTDFIDGPLLIVLDEDDDYENIDLITTNSNNILLNYTEERTIVSNEILANGNMIVLGNNKNLHLFEKYSEEQPKVIAEDLSESLSIDSTSKSKTFHRPPQSSDKLEKSNNFPRAVVIDSSIMQQKPHQQRRTKSISKHKNISSSNNQKDLSIDDHSVDSILSYITLDNVSNILTVSRMGSVYYCVEDLYIKAFSSLCLLDDFINLLVTPEKVILKQVTLSEKIAIEQHCPKLKRFNHTRYRLLSINSSNYLIKLKQLLLLHKHEKQIDKIIDKIRRFKRTPMPIQLNEKISPSSSMSKKRLSTDDVDEKYKHLKSVTNTQNSNETTPVRNLIQCDTYDSCDIISAVDSESKLIIEEDHNDTFEFEDNLNNSLTKHPLDESETCSIPSIQNISSQHPSPELFNINTSDLSAHEHSFSISSPSPPPAPTYSLHRSKSLTDNKEESEISSSRSFSLPSIQDNIMLKYQPPTTKLIDYIDDNLSMPMIVNVEENVEINKQKVRNPDQSVLYSQNTLISQQSPSDNTTPHMPTKASTSVYHPYSSQPPYFCLRPLRSPYNLYHQESHPTSTSYENPKELHSVNHDGQLEVVPSSTKNSPATSTSFIQKSNYNNSSTTEPLTSYRSSRCSRQQMTGKPLLLEESLSKSRVSTANWPDERMIYRQYTIPPLSKCDSAQTAERSKTYSLINRKQRRMGAAPYQPAKNYFAPLSIHHPQDSSINEMKRTTDIHRPIQSVSLKNASTLISPPNTPNGLTLPNMCTQSIDLAQAIAEHGHCDMDKIPKLVVRYKKSYLCKTVDTMGQLFPTWFNEPNYRCIHCFTCDQVFTPQQFMTHVDDEQLVNKQPLNITSIQLLTSEKMSQHKVELWNQFCSNLIVYARTGRINGFSIGRNLSR